MDTMFLLPSYTQLFFTVALMGGMNLGSALILFSIMSLDVMYSGYT
jgi:hypothetical protein